MKGDPPEIDPKVFEVYEAFGELIKSRTFRGALDALSADVLERCEVFLREHADEIRQAVPDGDNKADYIISAVVGWILGIPAGRYGGDIRVERAFQHNALAAFISAWSAENSARVNQSQRN